MKKSFKLALLGCASSCLMTAAYAGDDALQISDIELTDAVCGSEERFTEVKFTNVSHERLRFKGTPFITIDEDDTFEDDRHAVKFFPGSWEKPWKSCFLVDSLKPGHSCLGTVEFNPEELGCADQDHPLVNNGEIERTLVVRYSEDHDGQSDPHFETAEARIDTDVTFLGTASQSYAVLGDYIYVGSQEGFSALDGITQVEGNVAYADKIVDEDDLFFNGPYGEFGVEKIGEGNSVAAFQDAAAAYDIFKEAVFDYGSDDDCKNVDQTIDISGAISGDSYIEIGAATYCVDIQGAADSLSTPVSQGNGYFGFNYLSTGLVDTSRLAYIVSGELAFKGDEDDLVVLALPDGPITLDIANISPATGDSTYTFHKVDVVFVNDAKYSLTSDSMGTAIDDDNIFWTFPPTVDLLFDNGIRFAGNVITKSAVGPLTKQYVDNSVNPGPSPGPLMTSDVAAPYIAGGLFGLTDDLHHHEVAPECDSCHDETTITLNGFTIDND